MKTFAEKRAILEALNPIQYRSFYVVIRDGRTTIYNPSIVSVCNYASSDPERAKGMIDDMLVANQTR